MAKVNIKIEGVSYQVEEGLTILEAAKACGYEIPSLCTFNHGECSTGSCRVCLVEVKGARGLVASCAARRSNQSILKEISPVCSLEGLMLKEKLQYFGYLMEELTHWKRP